MSGAGLSSLVFLAVQAGISFLCLWLMLHPKPASITKGLIFQAEPEYSPD
jgi:hypothetical protein